MAKKTSKEIANSVQAYMKMALDLPDGQRPAFTLVWADPNDENRMNYVSSVPRHQSIELLTQTVAAINAKRN
jgi:hypothetical protein